MNPLGQSCISRRRVSQAASATWIGDLNEFCLFGVNEQFEVLNKNKSTTNRGGRS
jgi:hypothetical protein